MLRILIKKNRYEKQTRTESVFANMWEGFGIVTTDRKK